MPTKNLKYWSSTKTQNLTNQVSLQAYISNFGLLNLHSKGRPKNDKKTVDIPSSKRFTGKNTQRRLSPLDDSF